MYACPICHGEIIPDQNNPGYYLCYNCRKRLPASSAISNAGGIGTGSQQQIQQYAQQQASYAQQPSAQQQQYPSGNNMNPYAQQQYQNEGGNPYAQQQYQNANGSNPYAQQQYPVGNEGNPYAQQQYPVGNEINPYTQQPYQQGGQHSYAEPPGEEKKGGALGIVALILGIVTLITSIIPFLGFLSIIVFGIATLIVSIIAIVKKSRRVLAIIGLVLAILSIPATVLSSFMFTSAMIEENGGNVNELMNAINRNDPDAVNEMLNGVSDNINKNLDDGSNSSGNTTGQIQNPPEPVPNPSNQGAVAPTPDIHGLYTPTLYTNDFFAIKIFDNVGEYQLLGGPEETFDIRAIRQSDRKCLLTGTGDSIASPDVDAYYTTRQNFDMKGSEKRNIVIAGHEVPVLIGHTTYPDGVTEVQVIATKIKDGCQFDLTAVAPNEESALSMFNAVLEF